MISDFREFSVGPDLFGRTYRVEFVWLQTAISIRHSDSIDVKFFLDDGSSREEKVIAIMYPHLLELSKKTGHEIYDGWVMKLAAVHLKWMIETGEDAEKTLVTMSPSDLERAQAELEASVQSAP